MSEPTSPFKIVNHNIIYQNQTNIKYKYNQNCSMCIIGARIVLLSAKIFELFNLVEPVYSSTL